MRANLDSALLDGVEQKTERNFSIAGALSVKKENLRPGVGWNLTNYRLPSMGF
jgi:hypothetical protein